MTLRAKEESKVEKSWHVVGCATVTCNGLPWYSCGGTYVCNRCDRTFGWCIGACDDTPALCDECANLVYLEPAEPKEG